MNPQSVDELVELLNAAVKVLNSQRRNCELSDSEILPKLGELAERVGREIKNALDRF